MSADVVTADGRTRTVGAQVDPDLFWALRGGGGGFAAVTALTFKVRPAPRLQQVYLQWSGADAEQVVGAWQQWSPGTPRELWSTCKVLARPGDGVRATITAVWTGDGSPDQQIQRLLRATPGTEHERAGRQPLRRGHAGVGRMHRVGECVHLRRADTGPAAARGRGVLHRAEGPAGQGDHRAGERRPSRAWTCRG